MSFSDPSHVSPTTGRLQASSSTPPRRTASAIRASRTTPTECVFVSAIGDVRKPDSRTHSSPVSSPFPFRRWQPANTGSVAGSPSCGNSTVTPVRTSSPSISVVWPTRTPATSVIAFQRPGVPRPTAMPRSRALMRSGRAGHRPRGPRGRARHTPPRRRPRGARPARPSALPLPDRDGAARRTRAARRR